MAKRPARSRPSRLQDLLYGRQAVREALLAKRRKCDTLYLARGVRPSSQVQEIIDLAADMNVASEQVERQQLDEWLPATNHQGIVLQAARFPYTDLDAVLAECESRKVDPLLLILDKVQDPQNLGSLIRTAEACAVHGLIIPKHRAAGITPAVVNASAGAVEHMAVCMETNLVAAIKHLKARGLWVVGLDQHPQAQTIRNVDLRGPLAVVVGSEGFGLSRLVREHCDWLVELPMAGKVNSLNVAVAGSIVLFAVAEERRN